MTRTAFTAVLLAALTLTAGCSSDAADGDITAGELDGKATQEPTTTLDLRPATVLLAGSAGSCTTNRTEVPAGEVELVIANDGDAGIAVEIRDPGGAVLAERVDVAPGTSRELETDLPPGDHRIVCLPDEGDELVVPLHATGGESPSPSPTSG